MSPADERREARQTQYIPGRFDELGPNDKDTVSADFRVQAIRGPVGDWAAYFGNRHTLHDASVARYGHKLSHKAAMELFPNISGRYRE